MKNKHYFLVFVLLSLTSCRTALSVANVQTQKNKSITAEIVENKEFVNTIEPYKVQLEKEMNQKIAHTNFDLTKTGDNSNLGNLLADFTFEGGDNWAKKNGISGADAAVINIGGIRSTIGKGDILRKHVFEVMPFENEIVLVKIKGSGLQGLFDYYLKTQKNNPVSHLTIETEDGKISKQLINGKTLDPNKEYYIVTSDYLAMGGDKMEFFGSGKIIMTGIKMRDLFIEKFKENPEVKTSADERLIFKNKNAGKNE